MSPCHCGDEDLRGGGELQTNVFTVMSARGLPRFSHKPGKQKWRVLLVSLLRDVRDSPVSSEEFGGVMSVESSATI
jgi:hypothetical protein